MLKFRKHLSNTERPLETNYNNTQRHICTQQTKIITNSFYLREEKINKKITEKKQQINKLNCLKINKKK